MKELGQSVYSVLDSIYNTNKWSDYAGKTTTFNAANNGVGLPTSVNGDTKANAFDRFKTFDKAQYDAVFKTLVDGSVTLTRTITVADTTGVATSDELKNGLGLVKVVVTTR
jgi:basic membrane protein A